MALAPVLEYNSEVVKEKVIDIFKVMGFIDGAAEKDALTEEYYQKLEDFLKEIDISAKLSDFGYQDEHMETIVKGTMNSVQRQFNPRKPTEEDVAEIVIRII